MDHNERLIEFLTKAKTWFVPTVVVRPEAVIEAFARAIDDPAASAEADDPAFTQALDDSLLLETAVHTKELSPSDHYNLIVVALDYLVRQRHGFAREDALFLLYTMMRYLPELPTFDPRFRHRGAAALALLMCRDVGLIRLEPQEHFTIAYLLVQHCRAAMMDVPAMPNNSGVKLAIGNEVTQTALNREWRGWFISDKLDGAGFDRLIADMMLWHQRLMEKSSGQSDDRTSRVSGR